MADNTTDAASTTANRPVLITAPPKEGQTVSHNGAKYTTIREGRAYILVPEGIPTSTNPRASKDDEAHQSVFYNPIQQFNRDLSVLAIKAFGEDLLDRRKRKGEQSTKRNRQKKDKDRSNDVTERQAINTNSTGEATGDAQAPRLTVKQEGSILDDANRLKRRRLESVSTERDGPGEQVSHERSWSSSDQESSHAHKKPRTEGAAQTDAAQRADEPDYTEDIADDDLIGLEKVPHDERSGEVELKSRNILNDAEAVGRKRPSFRILDALSATGLRALRYARELPFVTSVTANDMSSKATESIALNIQLNRLEKIIRPNTANAKAHMYSLTSHDDAARSFLKYDVIDLDPYGTAVPFLDAAFQAINDNGLLCVTCTDAGVFNSAGYLEKTYSLYGGLPSKCFHAHEVGLRLILHSIATTAAKYGIAIEPVLSLSIDYYARVFVRIRKSPAEVKFLAGKQMVVYECDQGCGAWQTQYLAKNHAKVGRDGKTFYKHSLAQAPTASSNCRHCGMKTHLIGPMFGGPLHNQDFVRTILNYLPDLNREIYATVDRMEGMLQTAYEETLFEPSGPALAAGHSNGDSTQTANSDFIAQIPHLNPSEIDPHPFYFVPSNLARILHCQAPSDAAVKGALRHAGFRATRSHCKPGTIRTDAPWEAIWHIMREWVRQKAPVKEGAFKEGTAGHGIMARGEAASGDAGAAGALATEGAKDERASNPFRFKVVFDEELGREKETKRLVRYQVNPRADWGPMKRAK